MRAEPASSGKPTDRWMGVPVPVWLGPPLRLWHWSGHDVSEVEVEVEVGVEVEVDVEVELAADARDRRCGWLPGRGPCEPGGEDGADRSDQD